MAEGKTDIAAKESTGRERRKADCVTQVRMGNTVLVVSGYFKQDASDTAEDKMMKVLEAEARAGIQPPHTA